MKDDLIKRATAIRALNREKSDWNCDYNVPIDNCIKRLEKVKSADRPQEVIAQVTFDEEKLREIVKEAVERFKEEYDVADRPQGEWINKHEWANGFYERECSICGAMKPILMHTAKVNYCPNCGCRMKGADDD